MVLICSSFSISRVFISNIISLFCFVNESCFNILDGSSMLGKLYVGVILKDIITFMSWIFSKYLPTTKYLKCKAIHKLSISQVWATYFIYLLCGHNFYKSLIKSSWLNGSYGSKYLYWYQKSLPQAILSMCTCIV